MIALFLREIRIEHTLFALPFAYTGAFLAAGGHPSWLQLLYITLAVLGARTAAMAANRLLDRKIDALNPRTAKRATAQGLLSPQVMITAIVLGLLLTGVSAALLNPLCLILLPIAAAGILVYPLCKRFTWLTHFVLGAVDGFAPLGATVAITGQITVTGILLFLAVTFWVGGFDMLYALMDLDIDRGQGIFSLPARFGEERERQLTLISHLIMTSCLALAGFTAHVAFVYYLGIIAAAALILYEARLIAKADNVFALNDGIFNANMIFSVAFLATTIVGAHA